MKSDIQDGLYNSGLVKMLRITLSLADKILEAPSRGLPTVMLLATSVDVEGNEPYALAGGTQTLSRTQELYIEMWNDVH